jgi:hypothetical protein
MEIRITPTGTSGSVPFLDLRDDGLDIGNITAGTQYTLPVARGTLNQILKTDASGVVTWQSDNPFNQSLNTTDFVQFNRILVNDTGTSGSTDLTSSGTTIMTKAQDDSVSAKHLINKARGTRAAPTAVTSGDDLYELDVRGYNGVTYKDSAGIRFQALEPFTGITSGSAFQVDITEFGSTGKKQYLELSDQGLLIGSNPDNTYYTLPVARGGYCQILKSDDTGVVSWQPNGHWVKTQSTSVINTAVRTDVTTGTSVGSKTVVEFNTGDTYHVKIGGTIQTEGKTDEITLEIQVGSNVVFSTAAINLDEAKNDNPFELEVDITCYTGGANPVFYANGFFVYSNNDGTGANNGRSWSSELDSTFAFGGSEDFGVFAQWSIANANNRFIVKQLYINKAF